MKWSHRLRMDTCPGITDHVSRAYTERVGTPWNGCRNAGIQRRWERAFRDWCSSSSPGRPRKDVKVNWNNLPKKLPDALYLLQSTWFAQGPNNLKVLWDHHSSSFQNKEPLKMMTSAIARFTLGWKKAIREVFGEIEFSQYLIDVIRMSTTLN